MITNKIILIGSLSLISIVFINCNSQPAQGVDVDLEKREIQMVVDAYFEYLYSYNLDKLLSLLTDDVLEMPSNMQPLIGKDEYAGHVQPYFDFFKTLKSKEMSFPIREFVVTGDWAFQVGTYKTKFILQDESMIEDEGNFVWIFKKDNNGNWKWARVISNSSKSL